MNKKKVYGILGIALILALVILAFYYFKSHSSGDKYFKANTILLKSTLNGNEAATNNIKITSLADNQEFNLAVNSIGNLVSLSENNFILNKDESKDIEINLNKDLSAVFGVYSGYLEIKSALQEKQIPIVVEVKSKNALFATNLDVGPEYKEIMPGEKVSVGVRIFNLNDSKTHYVEASYIIKNLDNEEILSEKENIVVGTEVLTTKTIVLPGNIAYGNYIMAIVLRFENSVSTSSYLFSVSKDTKKSSWLNADILTIIFSIVVIILLFSIIFLVVYLLKERDKLFSELRKQHEAELEELNTKINAAKRKFVAGLEKKEDKDRAEIKFKQLKTKTIVKLKERHKQQKQELKKLKRHKKKDEMQKKMQEWKKQGFDVDSLLAGTIASKNRNEQLREWKKQGYRK